MARQEQILGAVRGFAQDYARESMPEGFCWSLLDLMPTVVGANLRSRNGWVTFGTLPAGYTAEAGSYLTYADGRFFTIVGASGGTRTLYEISPAGVVTSRGATVPAAQNPFAHREKMIIPNGNGTAAGQIVGHSGSWTISALPGTAAFGRFGCTYKDRVVLAAPNSDRSLVAFSKPGDPTLAWEPLSVVKTSLPVTGIAALRNAILIFHEAMTERIRGDTPPDPTLTDPTGNMTLEAFPTRVGCAFAQSIAYWKDSVIWADERGVHMTDGASTVGLTEKGGMSLAWRSIFDLSVGGIVGGCVGDFYVVTLHVADPAPMTGFHPGAPAVPGLPALSENTITLICNIPTRTWTRYSNFPVTCYIPTHGADDRERLFGGTNSQRVLDATESVYPTYLSTSTGVDANGTAFRPVIETPWYTFTSNRERIRNIYTTYELDSAGAAYVGVEIATKLTSEPTHLEYELLPKQLAKHTNARRHRTPVRRETNGIAFRFVVNGGFRYFNFYGLEAELWAKSRIALASTFT